ncbi:MAG: 50S ribosomal protein L3 [Elusimicrobia bacterium]|jgi:large subunit ribosomal protein L3|nr:50S ribosomal protein L3 [Elusimicrobiota bacterium]
MIEGILGKKLGMTRLFDDKGASVGVTLIYCEPCYIGDVKEGKVQIGFGEIKENKLNKSIRGYLESKNIPPVKYLKEVKWDSSKDGAPKAGTKIGIEIFKNGDIVDIKGKSKGKGFAGVMKRWGFSGGPAGHGSRSHRIPGSIGQSSDPSRVWPGLKMAGRKGGESVISKNLEIVDKDPAKNLIAVKGSVPGAGKNVVFIKKVQTG